MNVIAVKAAYLTGVGTIGGCRNRAAGNQKSLVGKEPRKPLADAREDAVWQVGQQGGGVARVTAIPLAHSTIVLAGLSCCRFAIRPKLSALAATGTITKIRGLINNGRIKRRLLEG